MSAANRQAGEQLFEALIALLVWGGLMYGLLDLGRALKRFLRPHPAKGAARPTAPCSINAFRQACERQGENDVHRALRGECNSQCNV